MVRHFLQLKDLTLQEYKHLFAVTQQTKKGRIPGGCLADKVVTMIFDKQSTRTRLTFEVGVRQLEGQPIFLSSGTTQMARGEAVEDSARIISGISDIIICRTNNHKMLEEFSKSSVVPLINGLSDEYHPCQVAADIFTFIECRGQIKGKKVAWVGDANNMLFTWVQAAKLFGFHLNISTFSGTAVDLQNAENCLCYSDPFEACHQADLITTDVWVSMNYSTTNPRETCLLKWKACEGLLNQTKPEALFLHCLPAHRGQEVSRSVLEGPKSAVFLEAQNRLYFQKVLLGYLIQQPS